MDNKLIEGITAAEEKSEQKQVTVSSPDVVKHGEKVTAAIEAALSAEVSQKPAYFAEIEAHLDSKSKEEQGV